MWKYVYDLYDEYVKKNNIIKKRGSILQVVKLQNYQLNNVINCLNKYEIHFQMMEHFGDVDVTSMVN